MFDTLKKAKFKKTIISTLFEAPEQYARILADEMGLTGEERYMFIAEVKQANTIQKGLVVVGATTILLTPYVLARAISR